MADFGCGLLFLAGRWRNTLHPFECFTVNHAGWLICEPLLRRSRQQSLDWLATIGMFVFDSLSSVSLWRGCRLGLTAEAAILFLRYRFRPALLGAHADESVLPRRPLRLRNKPASGNLVHKLLKHRLPSALKANWALSTQANVYPGRLLFPAGLSQSG